MKPRVKKNALRSSERSETRNSSRFDHSSLSVIRIWRSASPTIAKSQYRPLAKCLPLLLALGFLSWQVSAAAQAAIIWPDGPLIPGVDSIDCITSGDEEKKPAPDGGNSSNSPDSPSDIDDSDGALDDLSADASTRNYKDMPLFSVIGLDAATPRAPRIAPILLFPVHSFYCLHEHIRGRAPCS